MSKTLADLFNLPPLPEGDDDGDVIPFGDDGIVTEPEHSEPLPIEEARERIDELDEIDRAMPPVRNLESSDREMDEIANKALEGYNTLMDLGMQLDSRHMAEVFSVASSMMGHVYSAKVAKMNKKLKVLDLQMKKMALDQKAEAIAAKGKDVEATPIGEGTAVDRTELLKMLMDSKNVSKTPNSDK